MNTKSTQSCVDLFALGPSALPECAYIAPRAGQVLVLRVYVLALVLAVEKWTSMVHVHVHIEVHVRRAVLTDVVFACFMVCFFNISLHRRAPSLCFWSWRSRPWFLVPTKSFQPYMTRSLVGQVTQNAFKMSRKRRF